MHGTTELVILNVAAMEYPDSSSSCTVPQGHNLLCALPAAAHLTPAPGVALIQVQKSLIFCSVAK